MQSQHTQVTNVSSANTKGPVIHKPDGTYERLKSGTTMSHIRKFFSPSYLLAARIDETGYLYGRDDYVLDDGAHYIVGIGPLGEEIRKDDN